VRQLATAIIAALGVLVLAGLARADELTFDLLNDGVWDLQLEFYAVDSDRAWPGGDQVYILEEGEVEEYYLECTTGEKICFGAWIGNYSDPDMWWGVGPGGTFGCEDCCALCGSGVFSGDLW